VPYQSKSKAKSGGPRAGFAHSNNGMEEEEGGGSATRGRGGHGGNRWGGEVTAAGFGCKARP
jgi:hypothetical protein